MLSAFMDHFPRLSEMNSRERHRNNAAPIMLDTNNHRSSLIRVMSIVTVM